MNNFSEKRKKKKTCPTSHMMLEENLLHKVNEPGGLEHFTNKHQDLCAG